MKILHGFTLVSVVTSLRYNKELLVMETYLRACSRLKALGLWLKLKV